jgi:arabinogalactan oligomer / maltooligosaccharide transport system permease protein
MAAYTSEKRKHESPQGDSLFLRIAKIFLLVVIDAFAVLASYALLFSNNWPFAAVIVFTVLITNIIIFRPGLYPLRWMVPGLIFVIILVVYPIFYTVYTAFTNFGDGHLEAKQQVVARLLLEQYAPPDATTYSWILYYREENPTDIALWLSRQNADGSFEIAFAPVGGEIVELTQDSPEAPASYEGYIPMPRRDTIQIVSNPENYIFGIGDDTAQIRTSAEAARPLLPRFVYDAEADTLLDQQTNTLYRANDVTGFYETANGADHLNPGYVVVVGFENFTRFFADPRLQGPLLTIFIWTIMFAFLSVFTTFSMGLFIAIILNDARLPGKKIIRSLLIIPYAMPGVISIVIWKGMLNQELGIVTHFVESLGIEPLWFQEPAWTRAAIILVNLWLGYPYMMLICSGALQAIPSDIYEAAAVDGASPFQRFWSITLPLLLVAVGPLLIASFIYNFNNYLLIEALTAGDPPIPNSPTPAGYTDILINYVYGLAFGNSTGADYGYASAITIIIFLIVAALTLVQFNFTNTWEKVSENA